MLFSLFNKSSPASLLIQSLIKVASLTKCRLLILSKSYWTWKVLMTF